MVKFYEFHDTSQLMASWWKEDKKFTNQRNNWYGIVNLREPYIYLMALICQLYGEKDYSKFQKHGFPQHTLWRTLVEASIGLCTIRLDVERRGITHFPHGLIPSRYYLCEKFIHQHELKLAFCRAPWSCLLYHTMAEPVQKILSPYLWLIHHLNLFYCI
jgi:hypothetical protein